METVYKDATIEEVNIALVNSKLAFGTYSKETLKSRAHFLNEVAMELNEITDDLLDTAHNDTHLDKPRLAVELKRTIFQLTSYAKACEEGTWLDIRIDTADKRTDPPKTDLRKMLIPLGPVVVFGASNFPFAYSTAGGDMACALAAGCTVIIKAHPAHAATSEMVANAVQKA
ncbi:MAG TPA: aldehyde dehydrogenase family protein, partial [Flavisolibacter sp.]|nr:aldehyde dehydrogenase family protein [Flavisolibacter sp.]